MRDDRSLLNKNGGRNMKRVFIVSLVAALMLATAAGCSGSAPAEKSQSEVVVSSIPSAVQEIETSKGITALYISPDSCKIRVGEKRLLSVRSDVGSELSSNLVWECDDVNIVEVDSSGNVIGKAPGTCVVTVFRRDQPSVTAKVPITVRTDDEPGQVSVAQPSQVSTEPVPSPSSSDGDGSNTTIIYVTPPTGNVSYYVPDRYVYYYGRNNFSYSNPADGYVICSMLNHYLTRGELSMITSNDAQMMLNTLYARNGYIFTNKDLQNYFETQTWYDAIPYSSKSGNMSSIASRFDSMDKANCDLLVKKRDGNL